MMNLERSAKTTHTIARPRQTVPTSKRYLMMTMMLRAMTCQMSVAVTTKTKSTRAKRKEKTQAAITPRTPQETIRIQATR